MSSPVLLLVTLTTSFPVAASLLNTTAWLRETSASFNSANLASSSVGEMIGSRSIATFGASGTGLGCCFIIASALVTGRLVLSWLLTV